MTPEERAEVKAIYDRLFEDLAREELGQIKERLDTLETIEGLHRRFRSCQSHTPDSDGVWRYTEVYDEATLFEESVRAARIGAGMAAYELGVPTVPTVKWVAPESPMEREYAERWSREWLSHPSDRQIRGFMYPSMPEVIYLRADLAPTEAFLVAAHEVSHVADALSPTPVDWDESETRARAYARRARRSAHVIR